MDTLAIALAALLASCLTLFSGFGLGTLLMPVVAIFFPLDVAIAMTAMVHFANNIFKLGLLGLNADRGVILRFGVPAIIAALLGALLLARLSHLAPLHEYTLAGTTYAVMPVKLVVGVIMIGVELVAPPGWFGVLAVVPAAVGMIGQTRDLIRAPDITGLSGGYIIIAVVIQVMWLSWGAAVGDLSTQICSTAIGLIGVVNLALWLTRIKNAEPVVAIVPEDAVV